MKKNYGTLEDMQEDEVLFERIGEDPITLATTSTTLTHDIAHNILLLNENVTEA